MEKYSKISNLKVSKKLENFVQKELLKDLDISPKIFYHKIPRKINIFKIHYHVFKNSNFRQNFEQKLN